MLLLKCQNLAVEHTSRARLGTVEIDHTAARPTVEITIGICEVSRRFLD